MKYRIKCERGVFYPQYRWMFIWCDYYSSHSRIGFDLLQTAQNYLKDMKHYDEYKTLYIPYP